MTQSLDRSKLLVSDRFTGIEYRVFRSSERYNWVLRYMKIIEI